MYVEPNFKTKKALKEALLAGKDVTVYQPNAAVTGFAGPVANGTVYLEGPHYPKPHTWYAQGTMANGRLVKVK